MEQLQDSSDFLPRWVPGLPVAFPRPGRGTWGCSFFYFPAYTEMHLQRNRKLCTCRAAALFPGLSAKVFLMTRTNLERRHSRGNAGHPVLSRTLSSSPYTRKPSASLQPSLTRSIKNAGCRAASLFPFTVYAPLLVYAGAGPPGSRGQIG